MLYIGTFLQLTSQESPEELDRRHGEFTLLVAARNREAARDLFRARCHSLRETTDFFSGDCTLYLIQLVEMAAFPEDDPILINYKSFAGDPIMPFIGCARPSAGSDACKVYSWEENIPNIDGYTGEPFLTFRS